MAPFPNKDPWATMEKLKTDLFTQQSPKPPEGVSQETLQKLLKILLIKQQQPCLLGQTEGSTLSTRCATNRNYRVAKMVHSETTKKSFRDHLWDSSLGHRESQGMNMS